MVAYQIPGAILQDGHSSKQPPYFNGQHYSHWKKRFRIFVQSSDFQVWVVVKKGPKLIPGVNPKESTSNTDLETFEVTKEQQEVPPRSRKQESEYELFKMMEEETVESIFSRFSKIVGELKSLGMIYSNGLQVRKLIRSLESHHSGRSSGKFNL
ncbi:hypothetical protein KY290_010480 [Solanum tuberosum]|uniref:Gag-pol polyprotein n=1 Tax=Solanum tuberosum TaxID=4113 RepID=A0ABQ7VXW7_SOLTU|nr:hypothetical protein KY290_010480 [Solanum tuberosum]